MPIFTLCPSCGTKIKAPDSLAGRKAKCPKCGQPISVPGKDSVQAGAQPWWEEDAAPQRPGPPIQSLDVELCALPPAPQPGAAALLACPHCNGQVAFDSRLAGQVLTCPHCGDLMQMPAAPPAAPVSSAPAPPTPDWAGAAVEEPPAYRPRRREGPSTSIVLVLGGILLGGGLLALGLVLFRPGLLKDASKEPDSIAKENGGTPGPAGTGGTGAKDRERPGKANAPTALTEKQKAARTAEQQRQQQEAARKWEAAAEATRKEEAQKKAAAWVADLKAKLSEVQEKAGRAKKLARIARDKVGPAVNKAEEARLAVRRFGRIPQDIAIINQYAALKRQAVYLTEEAQKLENAAKEAEEDARQAAAEVIEAQRAIRQAEAVYYSLGATAQPGGSPQLPATPAKPETP